MMRLRAYEAPHIILYHSQTIIPKQGSDNCYPEGPSATYSYPYTILTNGVYS